MRLVLKIAGSLIAWMVAALIVTVGVEIAFGVPRPGFVPLPTLIIVAPILYLIWRPRRS
jgi:hypothetical protein